MLVVLFSLFSSPIWAQGVVLSEEQQSQLDQNIELTKERLELTDEQSVVVEEILRNSMTERFVILDKYGINPIDPNFQRPDMRTMKRMRGDMERLDSDTQKQLKNQLTKDQMKTWKKLEKERQNHMRERMMGRG